MEKSEVSEFVTEFSLKYREVIREVKKRIVGMEDILDLLMVALISRGHVLIEGIPGVAKTTLVKTFARTIGCEFKRIQFTPDLLPSDITGTYVYRPTTGEFALRKGPIFSNFILADEINRAPAKTQAALLEAMAEYQVTIEGETYKLDPVFMVTATQNPIEQEGVYMLPEAQLDRFMFKLLIDLPDEEMEMEILRTYSRLPEEPIRVLQREDIETAHEMLESLYVSDEVMRMIVKIVSATREEGEELRFGVSPRASISLLRGAKARAMLEGRTYVVPSDVEELLEPVLRHRLLLKPEAELSGIKVEDVLMKVYEKGMKK